MQRTLATSLYKFFQLVICYQQTKHENQAAKDIIQQRNQQLLLLGRGWGRRRERERERKKKVLCNYPMLLIPLPAKELSFPDPESSPTFLSQQEDGQGKKCIYTHQSWLKDCLNNTIINNNNKRRTRKKERKFNSLGFKNSLEISTHNLVKCIFQWASEERQTH